MDVKYNRIYLAGTLSLNQKLHILQIMYAYEDDCIIQ